MMRLSRCGDYGITNADAIIDPLAALTGFNIFCYCENDPVRNIDPEGYLLISGPHDAVKDAHRDALIALGHRVAIEVGFLKWGLLKLTGRADIIDATTGEVWEIKPAQKTFDKNPARFYVSATDSLYCGCMPPYSATQYPSSCKNHTKATAADFPEVRRRYHIVLADSLTKHTSSDHFL